MPIAACYQQGLLSFKLTLVLVKALIGDLEGSLEAKKAKAGKETAK